MNLHTNHLEFFQKLFVTVLTRSFQCFVSPAQLVQYYPSDSDIRDLIVARAKVRMIPFLMLITASAAFPASPPVAARAALAARKGACCRPHTSGGVGEGEPHLILCSSVPSTSPSSRTYYSRIFFRNRRKTDYSIIPLFQDFFKNGASWIRCRGLQSVQLSKKLATCRAVAGITTGAAMPGGKS